MKAADQEVAGPVAEEAEVPLAVGDVRRLYADGVREFTLKAIGGNCEIWLANDLSYPADDPRPMPIVTDEQIDYLFNEYNNNIYPQMAYYYGLTNDRAGMGGLYGTSDYAGVVDYEAYATDNPQRMMILVFNIIDEAYYDPDYPVLYGRVLLGGDERRLCEPEHHPHRQPRLGEPSGPGREPSVPRRAGVHPRVRARHPLRPRPGRALVGR